MKEVIFYRSQFDANNIELYFAKIGETVAQFLETSKLNLLMFREPIVVQLNGVEIDEVDYSHRLTSDDVLSLHAIPQGGAAAAIAYVIMAVGMAYYIDQMPDMNGSMMDRSPTYDIGSRGNAARLGAPKPVFYGTVRTYPDLGALPYTEYDSNGNQILYQLFEVRQGECDISVDDMRFEDTPLKSFEGYEVEVIPPGGRSTIFPGAVVVSTELDSIEIGPTPNTTISYKEHQDIDSPPDASYYACDIGQTITRIAVDVAANNGIYRSNDQGNLRWRRLGVRWEARKVNDANEPLGDWFTLGNEQLSSDPENYRNAVRKTFYYTVPEGRYAVRPVRTVAKTNSHFVSDTFHWVGLKGFVAETLPLATTTRIALKIRASEQLSNRGATKFNCVSVGKIPEWHPSTGWSDPVISANPAWVFADIARNSIYGGSRGDAYIGLQGLYVLAQEYTAQGIKFNGGFDTQTTVWEALKTVAAVGYAKPVDRAGVYYMVRDSQASVPSYMFSHSNIVKDSFRIDDVQIQDDTPDAYRFSFYDAAQGFRESSVICALPGSAQENIKDEKIIGVTDKDQVYKLGMYLVAGRFYRRRRVQFETGIEGFLPFFWDTISFSHYLIGREGAKQISGDVIAFDGIDLLTLSENVGEMDSPFIVLRDLDGAPSEPYTVTVVGTSQVRITQAFDASPLVFEAGYERPHFMLGEGVNFAARVKIDSIKVNGNNTYTIAGFIDAPEVYSVANGLPTPPITQLPPPLNLAPVVLNLRAVLSGTIEGPKVLLRWDSRNADYFVIQISQNNGADWVSVADRYYENALDHSAPEGAIRYRVSAVSVLQGEWVSVSIDTGEAAFASPFAPTGLQLAQPFVGPVLRVVWNSEYITHRVGFWVGGDEKYSVLVTGNAAELDAGTARSFGLGRAFTVKVWSLSESGKLSATSADLQVSNPVPGPLNNLNVIQSVGSIFIEYDWPNENDIDGVCVWLSTINNFVPSDANRKINRTKSRMLSLLMPDDVAYLRVAALDVWGDDFTASGQYTLSPNNMLDRLIGKIESSQLHQDLRQKIELIDAPGTGLVAQVGANTQNLINEINARLTLAQQMRGDYIGNNPAEVTSGLIRATQNNINELSSQMALLSAGSAGQFDYVNIWRFDINHEEWTSSAGTVVTTPYGWYTPNANAGNTYAEKTGLSIDAVKYTQLRFRVRKFGTVGWNGEIYFLRTGFTQWSTALRVVIPEPEWDANNIAMVSIDMYPTNGYWYGANVRITALRLIMAYNTTDDNYYSYDWIGVGRPSPGASSAELLTEQTARVAADEAFVQQLTLANSAIAGKASQTAVDLLSGRVTQTEQGIVLQQNKLTLLNSQLNPRVVNLNPSFADWTTELPLGFIGWQSNGFSKHTGQYAYTGGAAVSFVSNAVDYSGIRFEVANTFNPDFLDVELVFTLVSGSLTGAGLLVDWRNNANAYFRVSVALSTLFVASQIVGKKTVATFRLKRPANFSGTFVDLNCYLMANYNGDGLGALSVKTIIFDRIALTVSDASAQSIAAHDVRIAATENSIQLQSTQLNQVQNSLAGKADSGALQSLSSTVQQHGNTLTAQGNQIAQVQSGLADKASSGALNALSATVSQQGNQITSQAQQVSQLYAGLPGSGNLIANSEFTIDKSGWNAENQGGMGFIYFERNLSGGAAVPTGHNQIGMSRSGTQTGYMQIYSNNIAITPNSRHCFSANIAGQRCTLRLIIVYLDAAGNYITEMQNGSWSQSAGSDLSGPGWQRREVFGVAPANARFAVAVLRGEDIGQNAEFIWLCRPMLSEVAATVTIAPPYVAGNNSQILASVKQTAEVAASTAGGAVARWDVKAQVGDLVGGVGFVNDGSSVKFGIHADQFYIFSPGKQSFQFAVVDNKILIPGSMLVGQSIKTEHLEVNSVSASSLFESDSSTIFGIAAEKTISIGFGSFLSSGVRAKVLISGNASLGAQFANGLNSLTDNVQVFARLRIDGVPKKSSRCCVPVVRAGSSYLSTANFSMVFQEVLTAGWRAMAIDVIVTCRDVNGNLRNQNSDTNFSVEASCLVEENKV